MDTTAWNPSTIIAVSGAVVAVIGALGGLIITIGKVLNEVRAISTRQAVIEVKLDGQGVKLNDALEAAALAKGKAEGIKEERAAPQVSAGASAAALPAQAPSLEIADPKIVAMKGKKEPKK